jgi:hypothetical protein
MALRELLTSSQREDLEAVPLDRAGLIEHASPMTRASTLGTWK